jgi:arylsulfatase
MSGRPNIIFILPDQQRADTLCCAGHEHMITPNLDKLGNEGVIFNRCFTQGACCVPARASLFTGLYAHQHGRLTNATWSGEWNWVENLAKSGYQTASIGGMHLKPWRTPCGFEYRFVVENKNEPYPPGVEPDEWVKYLQSQGLERPLDYPRSMPDFFDRMGDMDFPLEEKHHVDHFLGRKALDWIDKRDDDRPLFLHVGFSGPHDPYDAPERYKAMYADRNVPLPHAVDGELDNKPPEQRQAMAKHETMVATESTIRMSHATPERLRRMRESYLGGVTLIDEYVGKIVEALDAKGMLENTIIIFASDHGDALGDNNMVYKWFMYDSITRVPLVVWGPKYFGPGRVDELVELFDLGPTILELAGAQTPEHNEARSLTGALKAGKFAGKDYVFCEEKNMVMVRGRQWKLVYYNGRDHGELYDLANDPHESKNLFDNPAHADRKAELIGVLEDWYKRTGGRSKTLRHYM